MRTPQAQSAAEEDILEYGQDDQRLSYVGTRPCHPSIGGEEEGN